MPMEDEEEQKNILDYAVDFSPDMALLYGLTRAQQDGVIKDIADEVVRGWNDYSKGLYDKFEVSKNFLKDNEVNAVLRKNSIINAIQNLPEEIQDSFLLGYNDAGKPVFDKYCSYPGYSNSENKVYLNSLDPYYFIHEYIHATNVGMNRYINDPNRRKVYFENREIIPDITAENGIGYFIDEEMLSPLRERLKKAIDEWDVDAVKEILKNHIDLEDGSDLKTLVTSVYKDMIALSPYFDVPDKFLNNRERKYKYGLMKDFKKQHLKSNNVLTLFAPSSIEGTADLSEVLAVDGGNDWMKAKTPSTYLSMMNVYENDPRKSMIKNGSYEIPKEWREHTNNMTYAEEKNKGLMKPIRVLDDRGNFVYIDDPDKIEEIAKKYGRRFFDYKDIDGNWNRLKPYKWSRRKKVDDFFKGIKESFKKNVIPALRKVK